MSMQVILTHRSTTMDCIREAKRWTAKALHNEVYHFDSIEEIDGVIVMTRIAVSAGDWRCKSAIEWWIDAQGEWHHLGYRTSPFVVKKL